MPDSYVPAAQALHVVEPALGPYWPVAQAMQVVLDAAPGAVLNLPDTQLVHVVLEVAPVAVLYLPAEQRSQELDPVLDSYLPAAQ